MTWANELDPPHCSSVASWGGGATSVRRSAFPRKHLQPVGFKSTLREFHLRPFYIVDQSVRPGSCWTREASHVFLLPQHSHPQIWLIRRVVGWKSQWADGNERHFITACQSPPPLHDSNTRCKKLTHITDLLFFFFFPYRRISTRILTAPHINPPQTHFSHGCFFLFPCSSFSFLLC